jgi:hypothetical protein
MSAPGKIPSTNTANPFALKRARNVPPASTTTESEGSSNYIPFTTRI